MESKNFRATDSQLSTRNTTDKARSPLVASKCKVLLDKSITCKWARIFLDKARAAICRDMLNRKDRALLMCKTNIQIVLRKIRLLTAQAASQERIRCKQTRAWRLPVNNLAPNWAASNSQVKSRAIIRTLVTSLAGRAASISNLTSSIWSRNSYQVATLLAWQGLIIRPCWAIKLSMHSIQACKCTHKEFLSPWWIKINCTIWTRTSRYISSKKVDRPWVRRASLNRAHSREGMKEVVVLAGLNKCHLECQDQQVSHLDRWCTRNWKRKWIIGLEKSTAYLTRFEKKKIGKFRRIWMFRI